MRMKNKYPLLILIILLGLSLRLYGLNRQDYWMDEALGIQDANSENINEMIEKLKVDQPVAPLYFTFLHYWLGFFGTSESSTRLLSLIFGTLSIILIFLCIKKLPMKDKNKINKSNKIEKIDKVALLAAFFMAIAIPEIVFSQETRYYACFTFFSLLSTFFFLSIIRDEKSRFHNYLLYLFSSIAALYTSYFTALLIFLHFSFFLFTKNKNIKTKFKKIFIVQILIALSFIFWLPIFLSQISVWQSFTKEIFLGYNLPVFISDLGLLILIFPVIILVFSILILYIFNKKNSIIEKAIDFNDKNRYILFILFSIIYLVLLPFLIKSKIGIRYLLFLFPALYFLISRQVYLFKKNMRILMILFLSFLFFSTLLIYYTSTTKAEWKKTLNFIKKTKEGESGILILEEGANIWQTNLYYKGEMEILPLWANQTVNQTEVISKIQDKEYVWLVLSRNWKRKDYYKKLFDGLYGKPEISKEKEFYDIKLYLYDLSET